MFLLKKLIKIVLSPNDDKRIQSIDSIETYTHGTSKDLVCKKNEIKCNNIIKQYKNVLTSIILLKNKRKEKNIFQVNQKFFAIHTEF